VLEQEHQIYPQSLALVASGAVKLEDGVAVGS
jgi:phosphoribosylglycinamide formyltransferase-1